MSSGSARKRFFRDVRHMDESSTFAMAVAAGDGLGRMADRLPLDLDRHVVDPLIPFFFQSTTDVLLVGKV